MQRPRSPSRRCQDRRAPVPGEPRKGGDGPRHLALFSRLPAGAAEWPLLEKLARLDYLGIGDDGRSPVERALRDLLAGLKKTVSPRPDYILLDARSGLHDLGGLSLHGLAHVDLLVMRDDAQSRQGIAIALRALCQRTAPDDLRVLVVEGMGRVNLSEAQAATERIRDDLHALFLDTVYATADVIPPDEPEAPHHPVAVPHDSFLERSEWARDIQPGVLDRPWVGELIDRMRALAGLSGGR